MMNPYQATVLWLHHVIALPRWAVYLGASCAFVVCIELLALASFWLLMKFTEEKDL